MNTLIIEIYGFLVLIISLIIGYLYIVWKSSNYRNISHYGFLKVHLALVIREFPPLIREFLKKYSGLYGEYKIYSILEKITGYGRILVNMYIPQGVNVTDTEIDILFIHESGIYIIESKDYGGYIYGNENDVKWTQIFSRKWKYQFHSPIHQNYSHFKSLEKIIPKYRDQIKQLIVFSNKAKLKNIISRSNIVINRRDLKNIIVNSSAIVLSRKEIEDIYCLLSTYCEHSINQELLHSKEIQYIN